MTPAEIRDARKSLGLTQTALAALLGRRTRAVQYWEADDAPPGQGAPADVALLLRYMLRYGLPEEALKGK